MILHLPLLLLLLTEQVCQRARLPCQRAHDVVLPLRRRTHLHLARRRRQRRRLHRPLQQAVHAVKPEHARHVVQQPP